MSTLQEKRERIIELLEKWAGVAPDECKIEDERVYVWRWGTWRNCTLIARLDLDRIQGAIQEAVFRRGIRIALAVNRSHDRKRRKRRWSRFTSRVNHNGAWGESDEEMCYAILSAYVGYLTENIKTPEATT